MACVQPSPVDITSDSYSSVGRDSYGYAAIACEPVVMTLDPERDWIVKNKYGAYVWVSQSTPILDVDNKSNEMVSKIITICGELDICFRLYETCEGLRLILPNRIPQLTNIGAYAYEEDSGLWRLFSNVEIDPKYKALCIKQKCFRARLSTKPWRSAHVTDEHISYIHSYLGLPREFHYFSQPGKAMADSLAGITRLIAARDQKERHDVITPIGFHDHVTGALEKNTTLA